MRVSIGAFLLALLLVFGDFRMAQAITSDALFHFLQPETPQASVFDSKNPRAAPQDKTTLLNQFYAHCVSLNANDDLYNYVREQCACTAAEMSEVMSAPNLLQMTENTSDGDMQAARMIFFAYAPCLKKTVENVVYERCAGRDDTDEATQGFGYCRCISENIYGFLDQYENALIPGFNENYINKDLSVANPLDYVLNMKGFQIQLNYYQETCALDTAYRG